MSRRRGRSSGTRQHPPFPQRAGRQASRSGHRVLLRQVQTGGCLVAHSVDPAEVEGYRALLSNQHPAVRKPRPGRRALFLCFPGSVAGRVPRGKETSFLSNRRQSRFSQVGQRQAAGLVAAPPGQEQTPVLKHRLERGPRGRQAGLATGHRMPAGPAEAQDARADKALHPLGPPEPQNTRAAEADSRRFGPLTPQ